MADFVLLNLERSAHLKQHEIAEEANVSVATVNRFCQTVGCNGFRDFNIRLAQSATINQQYLGGPSSTDSEPEQIIMQVFGSLLDTLKLVRSQLDTDALQEAVSVLAVAKRINFLVLVVVQPMLPGKVQIDSLDWEFQLVRMLMVISSECSLLQCPKVM